MATGALLLCVAILTGSAFMKAPKAEAAELYTVVQPSEVPDPCTLKVIDCYGMYSDDDKEDDTKTEEETTEPVEEVTQGIGGTIREVSAYTSFPEQTDDTPCIAADGSDICERYAQGELICAANFVPLGSKLTIDHYGTCTVADRMNRRFTSRVDVYLGYDTPRALRFGVQNLYVEETE